MTPLASIIVNNYNYGRFLREAIDSALSQTYDRVEVIVVDDGSTDNSREIIAEYGDRIVPVLKANGGQASAFNAGFGISSGNLILFLDADDVLEPTAIENVVREWQPKIAKLYFPLQVINEYGEPRGDLIGGIRPRAPDPLAGRLWCGSPSSGSVFSREALERLMPMPEEEWRICADGYVFLGSFLFGEAKCLGQPFGKYRIHGNNGYAGMDALARIRKNIYLDLKLHDALFHLANGKVGTVDNWLRACPQHWVNRIRSLRKSPQDHPWPDTLLVLTARALEASLRQPLWSLRKRLAYALFAVAYALLPGSAIIGLRNASMKMTGSKYGRSLRRLVNE